MTGSAAVGAEPADEPVFDERAEDVGIEFVHFNGMSGELYLAEITCGGGALIDFDQDGDLDIYLLQGHLLGPGKTGADALFPPSADSAPGDRLFRNDLLRPADPADPAARPAGRLSFTDISALTGAKMDGYGCGIAVGDVTNDGLPDLYVANLGANQLLRNLGGGKLVDIAADAGVADPGSGVAATFFDFDRDGWLDLFLGNNVTFDQSGATHCENLTGAKDYCGPGAYPSEADRLFRNLGVDADGLPRFADVTESAGLADSARRPTLGVVAGDFDGDGWPDLYVANDGQPNHLWRNLGNGRFEEQGLLAGAALNSSGAAEASMGVDAGDVDGDGDLDLFLAHLVKESNTLYRNDGGGGFTDTTAAAGLAAPSLPYTAFGSAFLDYDNDGWLDILVVNGAVTLLPELVARRDPFPLHQRNQLFHNLGIPGAGSPRFAEVSHRAGPAFKLSEVSRGLLAGDLDNDGDTDAVVVNNGGPVRFLQNRVGHRNAWLGVRLVTGSPRRDALGAKAVLLRGELAARHRWARSDGSYNSAGDSRVLFGLGEPAGSHDPSGERYTLKVRWPDGSWERFEGIRSGRYSTLHQGEGFPDGGSGLGSP